jgi:GrpB-like predicted nucleotidyltransferase (UPF0157 family)
MAPPIPVHLVRYNPEWPGLAARLSEDLAVFKPLLTVVHHIGSTSVPGMTAKPVIDLMPLFSDLATLDARKGDLEALGYVWHGEFGVEGRRFCTRDDEHGVRVAQLHGYHEDSPHARRQLAFRDYLRAFPEVAAAYEAEKFRARDMFPDNSVDYSREKGAFIRDAEAKALQWITGDEGSD